jgi:uncharacterized protein (DUF58 family)
MARGIRAERRLRFGWVSVGDRLSEHFEIRNISFLPALWVEVADSSNVPGYKPAVVRSLDAQSTDQWRQSAICLKRGQYRLGPWALLCGDPFGIFQVTINYSATDEVIIHPPIHAKIPVKLPAGQSSGRVRARERSWLASINAAGVRDYQAQDPWRWIHWPTSARHNSLFVRQFDMDAAGDIWLLLDLQAKVQLGLGADSTEEHAVLLAAALVANSLNQQRPIGLATYGRTPQLIPPSLGQKQEWQLLRALALVQADGEFDLGLALRDLGQVARRGSAVLVVTPSDHEDWLPDLLHLTQRGIRSNVVLLDRNSFSGGQDHSSTEALREAVRRLGVNCFVVKQGEIGQPIDEQERRGFWEFRVTGTGRVVTIRSPFDQ